MPSIHILLFTASGLSFLLSFSLLPNIILIKSVRLSSLSWHFYKMLTFLFCVIIFIIPRKWDYAPGEEVSHMIIKDVPEHDVQLSLPSILIPLLLLCMHITKRGALFSLPWRGNILGKGIWNRSRMLRVVGVLKVLYSTLKSSLQSNTINRNRLRINLLFLLLLSREGIYNAFLLSLHTGLPDLG